MLNMNFLKKCSEFEIDLRSFNVTIVNVVCTPILHKYGKEKL